MGGVFRKKELKPLPEALLERCLANPCDPEVERLVARHFGHDLRALIDFYRERCKEDPRHRAPLARAYEAANKPSLAAVQYRDLVDDGQEEHRQALDAILERMKG